MRAGSTEGCLGEVAGEQKEAFLEGTASLGNAFTECRVTQELAAARSRSRRWMVALSQLPRASSISSCVADSYNEASVSPSLFSGMCRQDRKSTRLNSSHRCISYA